MHITARVENSLGRHVVQVQTDQNAQTLTIPPKPSGFGSNVNGGELLFLALATCYCNDVYREAAKQGLRVESIEVEVTGGFGGASEPARRIAYRARVRGHGDEAALRALLEHTDSVAEIQNTLRLGMPVTLSGIEVEALN